MCAVIYTSINRYQRITAREISPYYVWNIFDVQRTMRQALNLIMQIMQRISSIVKERESGYGWGVRGSAVGKLMRFEDSL